MVRVDAMSVRAMRDSEVDVFHWTGVTFRKAREKLCLNGLTGLFYAVFATVESEFGKPEPLSANHGAFDEDSKPGR